MAIIALYVPVTFELSTRIRKQDNRVLVGVLNTEIRLASTVEAGMFTSIAVPEFLHNHGIGYFE